LRECKILRVARVLLINTKGEILLQQRGQHVIAPLLWSESAAGHVDAGESYHSTAARELAEEVGVADVELKKVDHFFLHETSGEYQAKKFHTLFYGHYDGPTSFDPDEVASLRWLHPNAVSDELAQHPQMYVHNFQAILSRFRKNLGI
jgi:16S rRNA (adenine1518-N6/adenine1519-N6)-dimethyltransferase